MHRAQTARALTAGTAAGGIIVVLLMVILWPDPVTYDDDLRLFADDVVPAQVVARTEGPCIGVPDQTCEAVTYELLAGADAGETRVQEFSGSPSEPDLGVGDRVVLNHVPEAASGFDYYFADRERRDVLLFVAAAFAIAVVALGGLRGVSALGALAASFLILGFFVLPAIVNGANPIVIALVGAAAIAYLALYIGHGWTLRTTVALVGALGALFAVGLLSWFVLAAAEISGFATEEALFLPLLSESFDFRGLVLAGIVLGTMGALDDVTVTQTEAVWELRAASPSMSTRDLFAAGLRIGRAHIGSTVNTLALAYAGASLPLLLLFLISGQSLGTVANSEIVATEIIRTLVGSVGLVASVPITTWLASVLAQPEPAAE